MKTLCNGISELYNVPISKLNLPQFPVQRRTNPCLSFFFRLLCATGVTVRLGNGNDVGDRQSDQEEKEVQQQ